MQCVNFGDGTAVQIFHVAWCPQPSKIQVLRQSQQSLAIAVVFAEYFFKQHGGSVSVFGGFASLAQQQRQRQFAATERRREEGKERYTEEYTTTVRSTHFIPPHNDSNHLTCPSERATLPNFVQTIPRWHPRQNHHHAGRCCRRWPMHWGGTDSLPTKGCPPISPIPLCPFHTEWRLCLRVLSVARRNFVFV